MPDADQRLQDEIRRRLLEATASRLPTSALGRLGRTAMAALRSGRAMALSNGAARGVEPALPDVEKLAAMVASIGELKGIAMKAGQILSYIDIDVPPELRAALAVLQTHSPPMPFDQVVAILRADLPDRADALLAGMEPVPAAAASIGQVHRARLPDGTPVAVKVRYPDIEKAIASDFRAAAVGTRMASLFFPGARTEALVAEARERFLSECDYLHEAGAQERFVDLFATHPTVTVPSVHRDHCSTRVLTTTWMAGSTFQQFLDSHPGQDDRDRLGQSLFEFYIGTLFRHGLYNCDPHPGNYVFLEDGRVAVLDYGCTREFDPAFLARLTNLTRAVHADTRDDLHRAFLDLGMVREGRRYDFDTARSLVRSFYGPMLRDEEQAIHQGEVLSFRAVARAKLELMKLSLPGEFLFLFRIRFGLMSILSRLQARANWYRLERSFAGSV